MSTVTPRAPLSVYMLADHLDGVLAAGEDLITFGGQWRALAESTSHEIADYVCAERKIAEDVRTSELVVVARTLKAREHARELGLRDMRFEPIAKLFVSGTVILLDAVEECGDATEADFETGDNLLSYIRSRGLIAPDAAAIMNPAQLTIDDSFLVAKRLALGPLLDMVAAFLDALELHFDLFAVEDTADEPAHASPRNEPGRRERAPLN